MKTIYLVSCVSKKQTTAGVVRDIYVSDWFKKARWYVEKQNGLRYILSAKHGLLDTKTLISPYEKTLY